MKRPEVFINPNGTVTVIVYHCGEDCNDLIRLFSMDFRWATTHSRGFTHGCCDQASITCFVPHTSHDEVWSAIQLAIRLFLGEEQEWLN